MTYPRGPLVLLVLFLVLGGIPSWAQKDSGGIAGTIKDPSGALVSGAQVTATDEDRGATFTTQSNELGQFVVSPLKIGRYRVSVEKAGFKKSVAGPIVVNVDERPAVAITLSVGSIHEVVEVTTQTPLLQTETSDLGQTVDRHQAETLPLNGRNYAQLALLGAGIAPSEPGSRVETSYGFSSNGARSLQNNFLLDGIDNNSNLGDVLTGQAYVIQPSIDAIEEFKVQTNAYSAEFGRGNGAVLNAVLKSGTNGLHGDLYEFFRNDVLDARNAFDAFGRQPYHQNQFGATLGGPIIKDRTFFFVDYEGFRVVQALPQTFPHPDASRNRRRFLIVPHDNFRTPSGCKRERIERDQGARLQPQAYLSWRNFRHSFHEDFQFESQWILRSTDRCRRFVKSNQHFSDNRCH